MVVGVEVDLLSGFTGFNLGSCLAGGTGSVVGVDAGIAVAKDSHSPIKCL